MAFLLTWINKFLAYNGSKKVYKAYLITVVVIAMKKKVSLGAFVLNHFYKGMNDLITLKNGKLNEMAKGRI